MRTKIFKSQIKLRIKRISEYTLSVTLGTKNRKIVKLHELLVTFIDRIVEDTIQHQNVLDIVYYDMTECKNANSMDKCFIDFERECFCPFHPIYVFL